MRPLLLVFGPSPTRTVFARKSGLVGIAAFLLGIAAAATTAVQAVDLQSQIDDASALAQAFAPDRVAAPARGPTTDPRLTHERVSAVNAAVSRLNLPWPDMLGQIERAQTPGVSLVAIEPDVARGVVRLLGQAVGPDGLVDYVRGLSVQPAFSGVAILKHRAGPAAASAIAPTGAPPLEFTLEVAWREVEEEKGR